MGRSVAIALEENNSLQHVCVLVVRKRTSRGASLICFVSFSSVFLLSHMRMGVVALASFTVLTLLSFKPFLRHMAYAAFLISHILLVLYVFKLPSSLYTSFH